MKGVMAILKFRREEELTALEWVTYARIFSTRSAGWNCAVCKVGC